MDVVFWALGFLFNFFLSILALNDDNKCTMFFNDPPTNCCKTFTKILENGDNECSEFGGIPSCDREVCLAKKIGYLSEEGAFIVDDFLKYLAQKSDPNSTIFLNIKNYCLEHDISHFGEDNFCDLIKIRLCVELNTLALCSEWEVGECQNVHKRLDECLRQITEPSVYSYMD